MSKRSFVIFCLSFFTVSFGVAAMAALIPSISAYFNMGQDYTLRLTWLYMLPYGVFALFWAPLTRVVKVKKIFLVTTVGFCLSALFFSLSQSIRQAFIFRFFMGCFGCSFVPLILITIGKTVSAGQKPKFIGILFSLAYSSTFISVFLSGFLHWKLIYLIPVGLSSLVFVLALFFLEDFDFRGEKFKISYVQTVKDREALLFFIVIMLGSFIYHSLQQRLGVYLNKTYLMQQVLISAIFTVATISAICFQFLGGIFSSRFGNIKITRLGFFLMAAFTLSLLFIQSYKLVFFVILLWSSGWALTHVGLSAHLTSFPDRILRDASSLNSALRFSFGGLGAFIGGVLVSLVGFKVLFGIVGISALALGCCLNKVVIKR
ncbi:MAG: MFS transporter [Candidatus Omnitrophota bacterium]|nr:MAG: MFS transporter [Candidatus Omnitrophota bacterium]